MSDSLNIEIVQGSTFVLAMTLQQPAGTPMNLGAYTGKAQLRRAPGAVLVKEFTVSIVSPSLGTMQMAMSAVDTATLAEGSYVYDLIIITGSTVTRILEGAATVSARVTVNV